MGGGHSQEDYERYALSWYENALNSQCILPDVGIDESLVKYSGINSNAELQSYSNGLVNRVPAFIDRLGSSFGALTAVPNAVGIGALVISMIMEIVMKSSQTGVDSYSLLRRVFGEEKASSVRDTMTEYLKRHRLFINNDQLLVGEIQRLEQQLSNQLTILRNSLLHDGQMSTRGFKIWVNGASFHLQMLIHKARLDIQAGKPASDFDYRIRAAIDECLQNFGQLLEKYKTYKASTTSLYLDGSCYGFGCHQTCKLENTENNCKIFQNPQTMQGPCELTTSHTTEAYINHVFSKYEPITSLRDHFSNMRNNIDSLINQRDTFTLPSR
eukprot:superscaffoldBa00015608_g26654